MAIYKNNQDDPMNPEVAILGGAGTMSFCNLQQRTITRLKSIAEDLEASPDSSLAWSNALYRTEHSIINDLRTVKTVFEELEKIRRGGGKRSKGIVK